jgi:tRNA 2-thiouridine synthesizing protein A
MAHPNRTANPPEAGGRTGAYCDRELDVRGLHCPLPILKTKKALSELSSGQILRILATDPAAVIDFQVFADQTGHALLSSTEDAGTFTFHLRKR